jgi:hypothetical protein
LRVRCNEDRVRLLSLVVRGSGRNPAGPLGMGCRRRRVRPRPNPMVLEWACGRQTQRFLDRVAEGARKVDLEKFFDRVNHDKLMGQIAKRVEDKRLLKHGSLFRASRLR